MNSHEIEKTFAATAVDFARVRASLHEIESLLALRFAKVDWSFVDSFLCEVRDETSAKDESFYVTTTLRFSMFVSGTFKKVPSKLTEYRRQKLGVWHKGVWHKNKSRHGFS